MNECWGQHWGEIAPLPEVGSGIAAIERAEITANQMSCLQPLKYDYILNDRQKTAEDSDTSIDIRDVPNGNPLMLQTIKLLDFSRKLNDNNERQNLSHESVPHLIENNEMHAKELNVFTIKDKNLNPKAVKQLLRRAVITIAVFHGYELTNKSVIDLLVDILSKYLFRLCQTIRMTTDSMELMSSNDFIDVIDRVFHDLNVPDFESLRQYDSDLRLYNQNLLKEVNKKIGINESINSSNKIRNSFQIDSNSDTSAQTSVTTQSDVKGVETTLSLKSLLSSFKTNTSQETEQLFDLTSLTNTSNKDID